MVATDSLSELVAWRAQTSPDREMLVDQQGRRLTFAEFERTVLATAAGLARLGIDRDTPVTWQLPTTIDAFVVTAALARLGAVQNPVMPVYGRRELEFVVAQTMARFLLVAPDWHGADLLEAATAVSQAPPYPQLLVLRPVELPSADPAELTPAPGDGSAPLRWIFYTSGSTSEPKGVMHTDRSVIASGRGMGERIECSEDDRIGLAFPVAHIGGCGTWLSASLLFGSALVVDGKFDRHRTIELFGRERVTIPAGGTAFSQIFLAEQRSSADGPIFPAARMLTAGASRKPPTLHEEAKSEIGGLGVMSGYGLTEAPMATMTSTADSDQVLASTEGRAVDGMDIRIVRVDGAGAGALLGPDQVGEIRLKGDNVMLGYVDSELTAAAFDAEGYFCTGDLGSLDSHGNLTVTGRLKDVIIRNGENISASEVEDLLARHPGVAEVAVIGLPHPQTGEQACAFIVARDPQQPPTLEALSAFLGEQGLARYKRPERMQLLTEIARNATGKPMKDAIRAQLDA